MGFAHFIARRILSDKDRQDRLSRPIVLIAVLGVVIGMAVMIITVSITTGFQREIRAKVTGSGAHLLIGSISQTDPKETPRIPIQQPFYPWLDTVSGVAHIQIHASKPGIIETGEEIQGVVVRGVGADHDWSFLRDHLVEGDVLRIDGTHNDNDLLLSRYLSRRLAIGLNDTITVYLVKGREDIRPRKFRIRGIYETGLEQFDHQVVLVDIGHIQRFAQWGLQAEILVGDPDEKGGRREEGDPDSPCTASASDLDGWILRLDTYPADGAVDRVLGQIMPACAPSGRGHIVSVLPLSLRAPWPQSSE